MQMADRHALNQPQARHEGTCMFAEFNHVQTSSCGSSQLRAKNKIQMTENHSNEAHVLII
jgi:hypothetical protein